MRSRVNADYRLIDSVDVYLLADKVIVYLSPPNGLGDAVNP